MQRWQQAAVVSAVAAGILWSPAGAMLAQWAPSDQPAPTASWLQDLQLAVPVQQIDEGVRQQLFDAVYQMLKRSGVPRQDMPREILDVTPMGTRRYRVHMAMVVGEGWFEVFWDGTAWQARGLNPPREQPESQAPRP